MKKRTEILVVDDEDIVRESLQDWLDGVGYDVAVAASAEEALEILKKKKFNIMIADLVMPGMDGVEATRQVKDISPRTQIIILTSFHEDEHIFPALQAGAISYLLKDVKARELVEAIQRAAKGEATLHPRVAARLIKQFSHGEPDRRTLFTELTEREVEVLTLIARGFTNQKIAEDLVISVGTVKGHVSNILSKLHLADRTQAAVYAWQEGIVRRE